MLVRPNLCQEKVKLGSRKFESLYRDGCFVPSMVTDSADVRGIVFKFILIYHTKVWKQT